MFEFLKDALFFWLRYFQKKKAESIVLNAEVISHYTGIYSAEIIKRIYEKQGGKNEYLRKVLNEYRRGKPKHKVYNELFEDEFLKILKIAEEKHVPVSGVFKDYADVKSRVEKAKKGIFSAIFRPLVIYVITAIIVYWALGNILTKMGHIRGVDLSSIYAFYKFYWPIMLTIPAFILIGLFKFPRKIPFLSKAFKELDGFLILSLCKMFLSMGISTVEIVKVFQKIMGDRLKLKESLFLKGLKGTEEESGAKALANLLGDYLSDEEAILFQIAGQTYEYERVINSLVEKRSVEFESRIAAVTGVLGELLVVITMIPVGVLVFVIMSILSGVSSAITF